MISIPGYTLSGKLYESARTLVFRAVSASDQKPVILKCIHPASREKAAISRFEREYRISRIFDDPRIARCIGVERPNNRPVMVFKDINGTSLDKIEGYAKNDAEAILILAAEVAEAIGRVHRRGIIHNDINPANIVFHPDTGRINLIDFGLSSEAAGKHPRIDPPDLPVGTLPYISPEQTRRINRGIDHRTDIYSFGITFYQMLTGRLPFSGDDTLEIMHGHIAGTAIAPHEIRPDLPPAVSRIIGKLIAKAPEDRYQSMHGVISDISLCRRAIREPRGLKTFTLGREDFSKKIGTACDDRTRPYLAWGATGKASRVETDFPLLCPSDAETTAAAPRQPSQHAAQFHNWFDWRSILKTFRSISREIDRTALLQTIMTCIIENAGAQRGILLLNRDGDLFVEAERRVEWRHVRLPAPIPLYEFASIPSSVIHYAARKLRPVIITEADARHMFSDDPYFAAQRKKSVLCSPVLYHGNLKGIIYLEHDSASAIFTKERVFTIDMLSAQAAVSLENAMLYERLKESENKYRSMFENAVEGIFQVTRQGTFISVNQSLADILGYDSPGELIDTKTNVVNLFFFDSKRKRLFAQRLREKGQIRGFEGNGKRRDGSPFWVSVSARAVFDAHGKIAYFEGSVVDIALRKQKEEAERQRKAAEAATRAKSIFLANMSHEIRTPLNAIIGLSGLSLTHGVEGKHKGYITKINHCASSLLKTIDDILHFSKFEAGQVELENIDFTVPGIMKKIHALFIHQTMEKDIALRFRISKNIPPVLVGDPFRLGQILTNLAANAFKFTQHGRITIGAKGVARSKDFVRLHFFVSDTGTGVYETDISRLFNPFSQADNATSRRYGGTGLGLAISKNIVSLMNGKIWATNNPDGGATFYFEVDAGCRDTPGRIPDIQKRGHDEAGGKDGETTKNQTTSEIRILLVDDNAINREIMPDMLESAGYIVDTASNGREAIAKAALKHYDAVLMDLQMPVMDGFETADTMRRNPGNENLLIIAMSAHAMEDCRRQCIQAGMTDYIPKPVDMNRLNHILSRTGRKGESPTGKASPALLLP